MPDVADLRARALRVLQGFSPSQLVIIGLLTVVAAVGGTAFVKWASAPTYGVLLAGLDATDAAAVTDHLESSGIPYKLSGGGTTVLVPRESVDAQRLDVAAAGLPKGRTQGGWAAFDEQGLTSSSFQQQVAYQRALESTLSSSLMEIDGIRSAQVHLALPEKRLFTEDAEAARASVLVEAGEDLGADVVTAMTHLVSSAVPGLAPADVSVTDASGRLLTGDGSAAGGERALKEQQTFEDALSARVDTMLTTLLGPGRAVVRVSAEIDRADRTVDSESYDPERSVVLSQQATSETYQNAPGTAGGGTVSTTPTTGTTGTAGNGQNGYTKSQSATVNGVTRTVEREVVAPGGIKRLSVAVAVDRNAQNAPSVDELTAMVSAAVGLDTTRGDTIAVSTPSFLVAEEAETPAAAAAGGPLALVRQHGPTGLGVLLLLLAGLGLTRTLKRGLTSEVPTDQVTAALAGAGRSTAAVGGRGAAAALPAGSVPRPRGEGELLGALDDNPDEVADLLRGWLTTAGDR